METPLPPASAPTPNIGQCRRTVMAVDAYSFRRGSGAGQEPPDGRSARRAAL
jgi:hypothetical protein